MKTRYLLFHRDHCDSIVEDEFEVTKTKGNA